MLSGLFSDDKYLGYIVASYGLSFVILGALCLYLALDLSKQWRLLRQLEKETGKKSWK